MLNLTTQTAKACPYLHLLRQSSFIYFKCWMRMLSLWTMTPKLWAKNVCLVLCPQPASLKQSPFISVITVTYLVNWCELSIDCKRQICKHGFHIGRAVSLGLSRSFVWLKIHHTGKLRTACLSVLSSRHTVASFCFFFFLLSVLDSSHSKRKCLHKCYYWASKTIQSK